MNRPVWPTPDDEEIAQDLTDADAASLETRRERYRFVLQEFGPPAHMFLVGGIPAMFAVVELQRSYIFGNHLAVILTAQAFVEHSLGGAFRLAGDDRVAASGFATLIDEALSRGAISSGVADRLHELRRMRNPYTHSQASDSPRGYMARLRDGGYDPEAMAERDAQEAIRIVVDYLRHGSPGWSPPLQPER